MNLLPDSCSDHLRPPPLDLVLHHLLPEFPRCDLRDAKFAAYLSKGLFVQPHPGDGLPPELRPKMLNHGPAFQGLRSVVGGPRWLDVATQKTKQGLKARHSPTRVGHATDHVAQLGLEVFPVVEGLAQSKPPSHASNLAKAEADPGLIPTRSRFLEFATSIMDLSCFHGRGWDRTLAASNSTAAVAGKTAATPSVRTSFAS
ncbi:MAG: hypothetical protein RLZ97_1415 [Verrucomicrobiota bacterium]